MKQGWLKRMHKVIEPKIMYFGTPVVLVSTMNEDNTVNIAPFSSVWWLGKSCMLGIGMKSQTAQNLLRTKECVINLPSASLVSAVNQLALTTGRNPVPENKRKSGYRYEADKFGISGLTPVYSDLIAPPCISECAVQLEGQVLQMHKFGEDGLNVWGVDVRIIRVHADESILMAGEKNYIDPQKWQPLLMNFCEFFTTGDMLQTSTLASIFSPSFHVKQ